MYNFRTAHGPEQSPKVEIRSLKAARDPRPEKADPGAKRTFSFGLSELGFRVSALVLILTISCGHLHAGAPPSNRFLLIVETSRSMQHRSEGVLQTVRELLGSGMHGQLREGDTLGVWTFNHELYAGRFPLQVWTAQPTNAVVGRTLDFLQSQQYEKKGRLDIVLPVLAQVVRNSQFITIILVSDGLEEVHGTPFDQRINSAYKTWRAKQQEARLPMVTVICARGGHLTDCVVNPAPWKAELPPLPKELLAVRPTTKVPATEPAKPPPHILPPLIVSGKKPELAAAPKATEAVAGNSSAAVSSVGEPVLPAGAPAPARVTEQTSFSSLATEKLASAPQQAPVSVVAVPVLTVPSPQPPSAKASNSSTATQQAPAEDVPNSSVAAKANAPSTRPVPETRLVTLAATGDGQHLTTRPAVEATNSAANVTPQSGGASGIPAAGTPPAHVTSVSAGLVANSATIWVGALGAGVCLAGALWYWRVRPSPGRISVITRSLDQNMR